MSDIGVYLYAVTQDTGRAPPEGLRGVLGHEVTAVRRAGLAAYVSEVPLDQFGEEPLRRLLEELDWVEDVARSHHRVVETLSTGTPVAPVRLVTVYHGLDQVGDLLTRRRADFLRVLCRVSGRREWGVKAYATRPPERPPEGPASESAASGPAGAGHGTAESPGTAYLRQRKESLRGRREAWRSAAERAERLHAALGEIADGACRHRPQDPHLSGRDDVMVLNGAYLLDPAREPEFSEALAAFRGEGMEVELTGPWAPYSFTSLDLDTDPGTGTTGPGADTPEEGSDGR
ncbi:GvpL/GvpF family gas vesicle protein [Microbispora sp. RL4-1S]|uniref:GvpL/GvpF family gas vesicle protein n=1 Tax=Microbispora oryzae TaxID=2806554 RepID=A0A940WMY5_9ACTN|nr:GvpL/GvpF family gas vesicle protein [Microbispora oryzae]MBP2707858.1 GvpL/GvpF family gas vesicle protein [Microbispora oryzae]